MGQGLASFLYGLPDLRQRQPKRLLGRPSPRCSPGTCRTIGKSRRKLTINIGLRHELEFGETERYNRANAGFDFETPNPTQAAAQANYALNPIPQIPVGQFKVPGGQLFASPATTGAIYKLAPHNFMPRLGISYLLNPKTVIRAGAGIFFESFAPDFVSHHAKRLQPDHVDGAQRG